MSTNPQVDGVDVGTIVANTYKIVSILGRGGMGTVWEAHHNRLPGKRVAIKVLHPAVAEDADALARFRREAEIACRLGHPNIVEVHDFNTLDDGTPYLILELLEGQSLDARLKEGALDIESCEHILRQIASALECAHEQGVVHRDLKPQNIFLVPSPTGVGPEIAKVLDFGISKIRGSQTVKTQESTLLGTPQYMAPEQATGQHDNVDASTDLFALAVMLYELLSGRAAFPGQNIPEVVYKVVHVDPEPIANLVPKLSATKAAALHKAMSKAQADRFASVADFVEAFTGVPLPAQRIRKTPQPPADAEASTVASTKMAIGSANTVDSQRMATPRATSAAELASAATVDSQKTSLDPAIAATIDSSKMDRSMAEASPKSAGPAATLNAPGGHPRSNAAGSQPKSITVRSLVIGIVTLAGLALGLWALLARPSGGKNEEIASVPANAVPPDAGQAEPVPVPDAATQVVAATADAAIASDAAIATDATPTGRPRIIRGGKQGPRDGLGGRKNVRPPDSAARSEANKLLALANEKLKKGEYKTAIKRAERAYTLVRDLESYVIRVKGHCHLFDHANANAAMRGIPDRLRSKRQRLKKYCKGLGINLKMK